VIRRAVAEMRQAWVLPEFRALVDPVLAEFCTARLLGIVAVRGGNLSAVTSAASEQPTQNWHDPGESDCLIKTKHCDGRKSVLTQCDFCPVL